jgi:hypothetical protein
MLRSTQAALFPKCFLYDSTLRFRLLVLSDVCCGSLAHFCSGCDCLNAGVIRAEILSGSADCDATAKVSGLRTVLVEGDGGIMERVFSRAVEVAEVGKHMYAELNL